MNEVNWKCHFPGFPALEPLNRFSQNFAQCHSWLPHGPTLHANTWISSSKGVSAHTRSCRRQTSTSVVLDFYVFLADRDVELMMFQCCVFRLSSIWSETYSVSQKKNPPPTVFWNFFPNGWEFLINFYRAMHFSAKRGIAIACRLSVRPSVRPSVTLVNCDDIGWNSSKIISRSVSLGCSLFATQTSRVYSKGNTPKFSLE